LTLLTFGAPLITLKQEYVSSESVFVNWPKKNYVKVMHCGFLMVKTTAVYNLQSFLFFKISI